MTRRRIARSGITGRFVHLGRGRHPRNVGFQTVPSRARGYRSLVTGRFVTPGNAKRHPHTTRHEG
jgi:hypothetical protein